MSMRGLGFLLIVVGLAVLLAGGIGITRRREVARIGRISASVQERQTYPAARIVGAVLLLAGAGLVVVGQRGRRT